MKVVFLVSGLMFGGGQRVVGDLAEASEKVENIRMRVCLLGKRTAFFDHFDHVVVDYDGRYNHFGTLIPTVQRLRRILKQEPPDIVHTHGWDADVIGWLAIKGTRIRQIAHLHVTAEWLLSKSIKHRARRMLTRCAFRRPGTWLVAVSEAVQRNWAELLPWSRDAIKVIRNGIDVGWFLPTETTKLDFAKVPVVGVAARLAPSKGIEYLLDALGALAREGVPFCLKVAGSGSHRQRLEQMAEEIGIADRVVFLGLVEDMPGFFRSIDVFVLPSLTEGMPIAILEAMASGLPIVATSVGGIPETMQDGREGFLVPSRDAQALAKAMRQLLDDTDLRKRMGVSGRQRAVEEFSLERFFGEVTELYAESLRWKRGRSA